MNKIETDKYVSRYYKISVNFGLVYYYYNSKTYKLRKGILPYIVGFGYFILTLITGFFWGFLGILKKFRGLRNSLEAVQINLSGGEDITKLETESAYDKYTIYVYNNLDRSTLSELNIDEVNIILEIQEVFSETNIKLFTKLNSDYILDNLSKIDVTHINKEHISAVFKSISIYNKYNIN